MCFCMMQSCIVRWGGFPGPAPMVGMTLASKERGGGGAVAYTCMHVYFICAHALASMHALCGHGMGGESRRMS